MADSTVLLAQIEANQLAKETTANNLFDAGSPATAYGRHAEACGGLTFAYYGTRYGGSAIANGSNLCGASTTTYMVVQLVTGAVSFSTSTTNWDDDATYGRCYKIVTGASTVTGYEDHRVGPLGILSNGGGVGGGDALTADTLAQFAATTSAQLRSVLTDGTGAGLAVFNDGPTFVNPIVGTQSPGDNSNKAASTAYVDGAMSAVGLSGFRYTFDDGTGATDPGAGIIRFNNATLSSVTAVYLDDSTFDSVDLSTLLGSLGSSGLLKITSVADVAEWRVYKWTAAPADNTGWWTFTVVDQAGTGTFEDGDEVQVIPLQLAAGSAAVSSVAGKTGAVTLVGADITDISEVIDDRVAAVLVAGSGITGTYNDGANTYTIAATSSGGTELRGITFTSDTGSTADSDPGAGLFKWNNATQGSATKLFIDNSTLDSVTITTFFASLAAGSTVYVQQGDDSTRWQLWSITAPVADSGYYDMAVTLLAKSSSDIQNTKTCFFDFVRAPAAATGTAGKHAVFISAASMRPSATGGCAALAAVATSANQPDLLTLDFDTTTEEYAQFSVAMPKSWNEGTVTFKAYWSHPSTTTNFGVAWKLQAVAMSDDDAIAAAYGTGVSVTDTGGTTNDLYVTAESSAITIAGTPAAEDMVFFRLFREPSDGSDNMAVDARLHGITLFITTDAENDA